MRLPFKVLPDIPIFITSFFLAFIIWLIAIEGDTEMENIDVPIKFVNQPSNVKVEFGNAVNSDRVRIKVRYPKSIKNAVVPSNFSVLVDIQNIRAGITSYEKNPFNINIYDVEKTNLPDNVQIVAILQPRPLYINAKLYSKAVNVKVNVTGKPPEGFRFKNATAVPNQVTITAEPKILEQITAVTTQPIDIEQHKESFSLLIPLDLPDNIQIASENQKIENPKVDVSINIEEVEQEYIIRSVEIVISLLRRDLDITIKPPTIDIIIKGPASLLKNVTKDSFLFISDITEEEGGPVQYPINVRFSDYVAENIRERVTIVNTVPKVMNVTLTKNKAVFTPSSPAGH